MKSAQVETLLADDTKPTTPAHHEKHTNTRNNHNIRKRMRCVYMYMLIKSWALG